MCSRREVVARHTLLAVSPSVFPDARPYPVNLRLANKPVLVVGAGAVAFRKIEQLLAARAHVTVIAPEVDTRIAALSVRTERRRYERGDVAGFALVITCTDDAAVNRRVHRDGLAEGVWVNSADDPDNCEFTLPSVVRRGDLQLAISTEGRSPALAMWLRRRFEAEFDARWEMLLDLLSDVRDVARAERGTSELAGWIEALDGGVADLVFSGRVGEARDLLHSHLGLGEPAMEPTS